MCRQQINLENRNNSKQHFSFNRFKNWFEVEKYRDFVLTDLTDFLGKVLCTLTMTEYLYFQRNMTQKLHNTTNSRSHSIKTIETYLFIFPIADKRKINYLNTQFSLFPISVLSVSRDIKSDINFKKRVDYCVLIISWILKWFLY